VNQKDKKGMTAFLYSMRYGFLEVGLFLKQYVANIDEPDNLIYFVNIL